MPEMPDAIILCGGAGLRLKSVTADSPKVMAMVSGKPFLELLLQQLKGAGWERVILAVGYRADVIRAYFGDYACGLRIFYSIEETPLGTGGALRKAIELAGGDTVLVLNGDSYTNADLGAFVADHKVQAADVSVLVVPLDGRSDCGTVAVDGDGRIVHFVEKEKSELPGHINAGIYVVSRKVLAEIVLEGQVSLERELFQRWLAEGRKLRAFLWQGQCIDIGTPERYWSAQYLLGDAEEVAMGEQEGHR
jgi:D-glycero-alpha-D-manno-heptose 1-phosphate guanylyltransferase